MKTLRIRIFPLLIAFLGLVSVKCTDEGTGPADDSKPGRRDYTWFVDTIEAPSNIINAIDGSGPSDVWIINSPGDFRTTIFHFNGTSWSTDGVYRLLSPFGIRVFSSRDAWIVGLQGTLWHFDGGAWSEQTQIPPPGTQYYALNDIDGNSPADLYAVGNLSTDGSNLKPLIYHLSNNSWSRFDIQDISCTLYRIRFYAAGKSMILGTMHQPDGSAPDTSKLFTFDGVSLVEVYSSPANQANCADFATVPGGIIISKGEELTFTDGIREQHLLTVGSGLYENSLEARTRRDVFLGMSDGIAHYNGNDVQYIYRYPTSHYIGKVMKAFPNSLFIIAFDNTSKTNLVIRGNLPP